jgi:heptosyltransferase-2
MRPLIVRLRNYVGDVVLSLPALELLQLAGYTLHLVGKPWAGELLAAYGWSVYPRPGPLPYRIRQLRALRRNLSSLDPGFSTRENMLVFPNAFSGALEARLAGLRAVGHATEGRSWLLARAEPPLWGHALQHFWALSCRFLRLDLPVPEQIGLRVSMADQQLADAWLRRHGVRQGFVVVCPFAGGVFENQPKVWPHFASFVQELTATDRDVVCCPGPADVGAERLIGATLIRDVDLGVYSGILRRAAIVVANDTGPGHLAAAVGVPTVSVLGPTVPEQWAPWGPTVKIVRKWPRWPTMDEVMCAAGLR